LASSIAERVVAATLSGGPIAVREAKRGVDLVVDIVREDLVETGAFHSCGRGVDKANQIDRVAGVVKAYSTRVGGGPMPTDAEAALTEALHDSVWFTPDGPAAPPFDLLV